MSSGHSYLGFSQGFLPRHQISYGWWCLLLVSDIFGGTDGSVGVSSGGFFRSDLWSSDTGVPWD